MVTHMWGHPVEMNSIVSLASKYGIPVVEDAAHAIGGTYHQRRVGGLGTVGIFSLGGAKMVTGGMGGVLLTNDRNVYERALLLGHSHERALRSDLGPLYRSIAETGWGANYRMSVLASILCLDHFETIEARIAEKTRTFHAISEILNETGVMNPPTCKANMTRGGWYGYKASYRPEALPGVTINRFVEALRAEGVRVARPSTQPLHTKATFSGGAISLQQFDHFLGTTERSNRAFPVAESIYATAIGFPDIYLHEWCPELLSDYRIAFAKVLENVDELRDAPG